MISIGTNNWGTRPNFVRLDVFVHGQPTQLSMGKTGPGLMISGIQPSCATNKHRCWTNLYCLKRHGFWRLKRIRLSFQVSHSSSSSSFSCCCVSATTDIHSLMVSHHLLHSSCHFCEVLYLPQCSHMFPYWIGLREMLQETIDFPMKIMGLSCKFSLKPIH